MIDSGPLSWAVVFAIVLLAPTILVVAMWWVLDSWLWGERKPPVWLVDTEPEPADDDDEGLGGDAA